MMRVLLFSNKAHLASPVVIRLVQLQQLLTLQHVHDLHLPLHVSPDKKEDYRNIMVSDGIFSRFWIDFDATLGLVTYL